MSPSRKLPTASRSARPSRWRSAWSLAALAALAAVLWLTVREDELVTWQNLTGANLVPLRHHWAALRCVINDCAAAAAARHYLMVDVVGNVLLFLPIGFTFAGAAPVAGRGRRVAVGVVAAALLSTAIEVAQLYLASRATDVDDILFNTLGAVLGAWLLAAVVGPPERRSWRDAWRE